MLPVVAAGGEPRATVPALVAAALLDCGGGPAVKLVSILTSDWLIPCMSILTSDWLIPYQY